jgi:hypothetical protein
MIMDLHNYQILTASTRSGSSHYANKRRKDGKPKPEEKEGAG